MDELGIILCTYRQTTETIDKVKSIFQKHKSYGMMCPTAPILTAVFGNGAVNLVTISRCQEEGTITMEQTEISLLSESL